MKRFVLGSGLLRRGDGVLLARCRYEGEPKPLWVLPGGGQETGEPLRATIIRELVEEASLDVSVGELAYVSESVDAAHEIHVLNCTFWVREANPAAQPLSSDPKVIEARFVPVSEAPGLLQADVIRIPVSAALNNPTHPHYFFFRSEDIVVPFFGRHKVDGYRGG